MDTDRYFVWFWLMEKWYYLKFYVLRIRENYIEYRWPWWKKTMKNILIFHLEPISPPQRWFGQIGPLLFTKFLPDEPKKCWFENCHIHKLRRPMWEFLEDFHYGNGRWRICILISHFKRRSNGDPVYFSIQSIQKNKQ